MLFSVCHHQIQPVLFGWSAGGGRGRSPIVYGPVGTGVICVRWAVWLCPGFDACGWFCFFFSSEPALVLCACVYHRPDPFLWVVCHGSHPVLSCGVPACVVVPCWRAGLVGFLTLPCVPLGATNSHQVQRFLLYQKLFSKILAPDRRLLFDKIGPFSLNYYSKLSF